MKNKQHQKDLEDTNNELIFELEEALYRTKDKRRVRILGDAIVELQRIRYEIEQCEDLEDMNKVRS